MGSTNPLLSGGLRKAGAALDAFGEFIILGLVGGDLELGSSGVGLELEGVELLSDAGKSFVALESLVGGSLRVLGVLALLLLGSLGTDDALVLEGGLQPLELRPGHAC